MNRSLAAGVVPLLKEKLFEVLATLVQVVWISFVSILSFIEILFFVARLSVLCEKWLLLFLFFSTLIDECKSQPPSHGPLTQ